MAGYPCAFVEDFHDLGTEANLEVLVDQAIGHRVVVPVYFHVAVNVDVDQLPLGILIGLDGQGAEGGTVQGLEHTLREPVSSEGSPVQVHQQVSNRGVQLQEREKV